MCYDCAMAIFLPAKQFVDLLFQFQWLDYLMVIFALFLIICAFTKGEWSLGKLIWPDFLVLSLAFLSLTSFAQDISSYQTFFKVLSAYLLYFTGRICYGSAIKYTHFCSHASYIIVWMNFIHKLIRNHWNLFARPDNSGEFYYYKTDMAFAMILCAIFITLYGKRILERFLTVLLIIPYMVFSSGARMLWFGLILVYAILGLFLIETKTKRELRPSPKNITIFLGICVILISLFLLIVSNKSIHEKFDTRFYFDFSEGIFTENNTHGRMRSLPAIWNLIHRGPIVQTLFGHSWDGEVATLVQNNIPVADCHCLYLKYLYTNGYVGLITFLAWCGIIFQYANKQTNRKLYYNLFGILSLFLITGISVSAINMTQMSWFPFLFAGMCVTSEQNTH